MMMTMMIDEYSVLLAAGVETNQITQIGRISGIIMAVGERKNLTYCRQFQASG